MSSTYEGDIAPALKPGNLPGHLKNSPYVDRYFGESDNWTRGLRMDYHVVMKSGVLPGYSEIVTSIHSNTDNVRSFETMNTSKPPPSYILTLWQNIAYVFHNPELKGSHLPFFSWSQYGTMLTWLQSIMEIGQDETYWHWILTSNEKMSEDLERLAVVLCTFKQLQSVYAHILFRFGLKDGMPSIPQEWWNEQAHIGLIENEDGLGLRFVELMKTLFNPAPHYPYPMEGEFVDICNFVQSSYVEHSNKRLNITRLFFLKTQPRLCAVLDIYKKVYASYYAKYLQKAKLANIEEVLALYYYYDWLNLAGYDVLKGRNYKLLREKWGEPIPAKKMEVLVVNRVLLDSKNQLPALQYPPPKKNQVIFLKNLEQRFGTVDKTTIPIPWLLDAVDLFETTGYDNPLQDKYEWKMVLQRLEDPDQWQSSVFVFTAMIQGAYKVSLLCHELSKHWTLEYEDWVWNAFGLNKSQQELAKRKLAPYDTEYSHQHWPEPWKLSGDELEDYIDYQCGIQKRGAIPSFRASAPLEDPVTYEDAKKHSEGYYRQWRALISKNPQSLEKYPMKGPINVTIDGKSTQIINYYPDFGVWEVTDTRSPWAQAVGNFLSPWKALTGHTLLDELLERVKKIVNALWPLIQQSINDLASDFNKVVLGVIGLGAVAIVGLREINSYQANKGSK